MVPVDLWHSWWQNGNLRAEDAQRIFGANAPKRISGNTPLILEGTGFLEPRPVPTAEEGLIHKEELLQKLLERVAPTGFGGARKMFHYRRDRRSPFYQTFQLLFTNNFLRGQPASTPPYICFAVCHPQKRTIGVSFEDFVRSGPDSVALWAEPSLNPVEAATIRDSMKDMFPMPPLEPPTKGPSDTERERVMRLHRPPASQLPEGTVQVEWYIKSTLCSEERIQAIEKAMRAGTLRKLLRGSTVTYEGVTEQLHGWRLVLYLDGTVQVDEHALRRLKPEDGTEEEGSGGEDDDAF